MISSFTGGPGTHHLHARNVAQVQVKDQDEAAVSVADEAGEGGGMEGGGDGED